MTEKEDKQLSAINSYNLRPSNIKWREHHEVKRMSATQQKLTAIFIASLVFILQITALHR